MKVCKSIIKIVLGLVVKLLLLVIWCISIYVFCGLIYDRYVLELYPLGDKVLVLIFMFGNIWIIPWLILWCKKLYPFLSKPKIYYSCKSWIAEKREASFAFKSLFFIIELILNVNVNIRMYNFDDVQCTVIPSVAYGFVTGMNLQLC